MATPIYTNHQRTAQSLAGNNANIYSDLGKATNAGAYYRSKAYRLGVFIAMFIMFSCIPLAVAIHAKTKKARANVQRATYELVQEALPSSIIKKYDKRKNTTP